MNAVEQDNTGDSLICPHCEANMNHVVEPDMTYEKCPRCDGLFLDPGELNTMATGMPGDIEYCSIQADDDDQDRFPVRVCPKCPGQKMKKENLLVYSSLIFDLCENCHGWFLDRGELKKMNAVLGELRRGAAKAKQVLSASARSAVLSFHRSALAKLGKKRTLEVLDDRVSVCYSDCGDKEFAPTESERQNLIEALVDVVIAIDESKRS